MKFWIFEKFVWPMVKQDNTQSLKAATEKLKIALDLIVLAVSYSQSLDGKEKFLKALKDLVEAIEAWLGELLPWMPYRCDSKKGSVQLPLGCHILKVSRRGGDGKKEQYHFCVHFSNEGFARKVKKVLDHCKRACKSAQQKDKKEKAHKLKKLEDLHKSNKHDS